MNMTFLLPSSVFLLMVCSMLLTRIKDIKTLWNLTMLAVVGETILIGSLFFAGLDGISIHLPLFSDFGIGFSVNGLGLLFCLIACVLWLISTIQSFEYFQHHNKHLSRYYASILMTLAGCIGVFLANDLFTLFIFFELMSFTSYLWVAHNQDDQSITASNVYLAFVVIGGLVMLFGLFILSAIGGDLTIANLTSTFGSYKDDSLLYIGCGMLFFGFGAKAGVFMLHDWLPLAYTASPAPASGLLSGLLSKTGLYGIIIVTVKILPHSTNWAIFVLILGMFNMLVGAGLAFMSSDLKRTLAFSSISQIGFILWGIALMSLLGEHNTIAAYGTVMHMINHSFIKILLFSCAGIMFQNTQSLNLNDLQGFGKNKPWLKAVFGIGAVSLMGIPLFSGYISKTLLHEAMVEYMHLFAPESAFYKCSEMLFLIAGGFTFAYMLKLFICLFVKNPNKKQTQTHYVTQKTKIALTAVCVILVLIGIVPNTMVHAVGGFTANFMDAHILESNVAYFSWVNLKGGFTSIIIGLFIYFVIVKTTTCTQEKGYIELWNPNWTIIHLVYRPILGAPNFICTFFARLADVLVDIVVFVLNRLFFKSVAVPKTFLDGKHIDDSKARTTIHITYSLAYSLLLFGVGFIFTLIYLLVS